MTGYAINAKSEALELHELSSEELDSVSGGIKGALEGVCSKDEGMGGGGGMFNQIMQQVQQMQPR
jgi:hypothetical protein